jgi:hypothetical protein
MNVDQIIDEKLFEEQKRRRSADPRLMWQVLQETIDWVDSQQPIPRNSRRGCLANQEKLLASMAQRIMPASDL